MSKKRFFCFGKQGFCEKKERLCDGCGFFNGKGGKMLEKPPAKEPTLYVVKNKNGEYFCGYNQWDKQLRKSKLYVSKKYAEETANFRGEKCEIKRVLIFEVDENAGDKE